MKLLNHFTAKDLPKTAAATLPVFHSAAPFLFGEVDQCIEPHHVA